MLKSLILSMFAYGITYKVVPEYIIEELEKMIWSFLWDNKPEGVNRSICKQSKQSGGMSCVDIRKMIMAKRIMLVKKNCKW